MSRGIDRRRGLTLVELLMAAAMTALVTSAGMALLLAAAQTSGLTDDTRSIARRGYAALDRLKVSIRAARTLSVDSATQFTLWAADDDPNPGTGGAAGDDKAEVSEIEEIQYDAGTRQLIHTDVDFTGADALTRGSLDVAVTGPGFGAISLGNLVQLTAGLQPYARQTVWASDVTSLAFSSHLSNGRVTAVNVALTIGYGDSAQTFSACFRLRSPGYYTNDGTISTNDGLTGGRLRLMTIQPW